MRTEDTRGRLLCTCDPLLCLRYQIVIDCVGGFGVSRVDKQPRADSAIQLFRTESPFLNDSSLKVVMRPTPMPFNS